MAEETLIQKIRRLPPERVAEVEDFVDFLTARRLVSGSGAREPARDAPALRDRSH